MPMTQEQILNEIISCIELLNQELKGDGDLYQNRQYEQIEQSNVSKLTIKMKLDALIAELVIDESLQTTHTKLVKKIVQYAELNSDLLLMNSTLVAKNLNYYDQLVKQLTKPQKEHSNTYNKHATTD